MSCSSTFDDFIDKAVDLFKDIWYLQVAILEGDIEYIWDEIGYPIVEFVFNTLGYEGEDIYTVTVFTVKLLEDTPLYSLPLNISQSIIEERDIVEELVRVSRYGAVAGVSNYLNYGENKYTQGLPAVTYDFRRLDEPELKSIIETEDGEGISITSASLGVPDGIWWCINWLYENHSDYYYTNPVSSPTIVRWHDPAIHVEGIGSSYTDGVATLDSIEYDVASDTYTINFFSTWSGPIAPPLGGSYTGISLPDTLDYYFVSYARDSNSLEIDNWWYKLGTGTYLSIESAAQDSNYYNKVLPIVALRRDFHSTNDVTAPNYVEAEATTARRLVNILNMDYDTIIEEIEANDENLAEIEDAFIVFATNLYTTAQSELRVLFELLSNFGADAQVTRAVFEADNQSLSTNVVNILEGYFNASFQFNWMETTTITGVLSQTGTYTSTVDIIPLDPDVPDQGVESFFTLSYQISDTEYVELVLHGPMLYHTIKTTVGSYKVKTIQLSSDPAEQVDFNIPLTLDSLEELPYKDKEEVIYRSMTLCIYASSYNYLEWYETARFTSDFSIAVKIIAIVILIYSLGTAATVSAALWALASQVLIQIAIAYALEYILTEYGAGSVQGAAAIAAYIYIAYITGDTSGLSDAFDLLRLATITIDVSLINTAVELEALDLEIGAFEKDAEEKEEELQTAWDYLDVAEYNPLYLKRITQTYPDESPGDYYTRTIHTGNPGVNALNQIETYVENLLLLPELDIYSLDPSIKDL